MRFIIDDNHFIKCLWVNIMKQNVGLRCFLTENEILMGQKYWSEEMTVVAALINVCIVVDHWYCHAWLTSVNTFVSYPAHSVTDRKTDELNRSALPANGTANVLNVWGVVIGQLHNFDETWVSLCYHGTKQWKLIVIQKNLRSFVLSTLRPFV